MLRRLIFWEFPRGGWQYDVVVGLICAFLFLTPRSWFRDQPRLHKPGGIAVAQTDHGGLLFFVDKQDLAGTAAEKQTERLTSILRSQMGSNRLQVTHLEPILDAEGEVQGYMASARP